MVSRVSRVIAAIGLLAASGLVFAGNATAAPYTANGVTISDASPIPGDPVTVTAGGYKPSSEVRISILSDPILLASPSADANGKVSAEVTIPADFEPGSKHVIELAGTAPGGEAYVASIQITLGGGLPATGASSGPVLLLALALVGAGVAVVAVARHRRRSRV